MRMRVLVTSFALRCEIKETGVNRYASGEISAIPAEMHVVVVLCVIFSSHLSVYHLARSFLVLLFVFSRRRNLLYPLAFHWLQQFGKR